jgi:phosphatidylserine decarboxylase
MQRERTAHRPMPKQSVIAREGWPFVGVALALSLILGFAGTAIGAGITLALAAFIAFFFRNPTRHAPAGAGLIIAPADGRVIVIARGMPAPHTGSEATKVSIFMSLLDVHINRAPFDARVREVSYEPGRFFVASLDKASDQNERNALILEDERGRATVLVQIAGVIARRIVCYARDGANLLRGEPLGLIRFGSRVDLYLPPEARIDVALGTHVKAGETVIGSLP